MLVNSGRHIDAVNLAFAFELTQQFSPVSLLKSYLTEARRVPSAIKAGNLSPNAQVFSSFSALHNNIRGCNFDPSTYEWVDSGC